MPGSFTLIYPQALLLGLLLAWLYWRHVRQRRLWRTLAVVLTVVLLGYPLLVQPRRALDLYVLVDRSRSISTEGRAKQSEVLELLPRQLKQGDRLGVVSFNERPYLEQLAVNPPPLSTFRIPWSEEASDLSQALSFVLGQASPARRTRVLILSDGEYTGANPEAMGQLARQQNIALDYRLVARQAAFNLSTRALQPAGTALANEPAPLNFRVQATQDAPGRYRLVRNGQIVGGERDQGWRATQWHRGDNLIAFDDVPRRAGVFTYRLEVEAVPADREVLRHDNTAELNLGVSGERPLLLLNATGQADSLANVLQAGGVQVHVAAIDNFRLGMNELSGYKGIVLNNAPVLGLSLEQQRSLGRFVTEEGGGLLVAGGPRSFGQGGYYRSELEKLLPVSLEDRQQGKRVSTAVSIVMDRSGSMAVTVPGGQTKIALADEAAIESLQLMSPADSLSVIAVDSAAHVMAPQQSLENRSDLIRQIRSIESMGGGIFIYNALVAAGEQLLGATQLNKHILLFSDAADSEQPGDYRNLLSQFRAAGVTVSVIGLGTEHDVDAELLRDIAKLGGGSIYFTQDAQQLVQFFTADTLTYTRNSFVTESAPMAVRAPALALAPAQHWKPFTASHYNLLFSRPGADVALMTADSDQAPILAFWQRELGRVATLALQAEPPFAADPQFPEIALAAAHWMMGSEVVDRLDARIHYDGTAASVRVDVADEERARLGLVTLEIHSPSGRVERQPLAWEGTHQLAAQVTLREPGAHRAVIRAGGEAWRLPPLALPASPEFQRDLQPGFGRAALARLAALSGGQELLDLRQAVAGSARARVQAPLTLPLLLALLALFLLDIAEQRFGMLAWLSPRLRSRLRRRQSRHPRATVGATIGTPTQAPQASPATQTAHASMPTVPTGQATTPNITTSAPASTASAQPPPEGLDYLGRAKRDARRRMSGPGE